MAPGVVVEAHDLAFVAWLVVLVAGPAFQLTVSFEGLAAAFLNLFPMALAFGSVALAVGAGTGGRGPAVGVASGAALVTFLLRTFASTVSWVEPYRVLSPFYYYTGHDPLRTGFDVVDPLVLGGISVVALAVGLVAFERRDLAT
jgi:ABC-2 type transport system permease protein